MRLVVLHLISVIVENIARHVCGSIKEVWVPGENTMEGEFILSLQVVKEQSGRIRIIRNRN